MTMCRVKASKLSNHEEQIKQLRSFKMATEGSISLKTRI